MNNDVSDKGFPRFIGNPICSSKKYRFVTARQGQCFGSIVEGMKRIVLNNENVYRVDLTSAVLNDNIVKHFYELVDKLVVEFDIRIEYLFVLTDEGNGVLHVLLNCPFADRTIIDNWWKCIHGSQLQRCTRVDDIEGSMFRIAQYLSDQKGHFVDFYVSRGWYDKQVV